MKKLLSVILAIVMILTTSVCAFAATKRCAVDELKFNADGKFKILMFNDTQDVGKFGNPKMTKFVKAALEQAKPDLVVFVGDQLSDVYLLPSLKDYSIALDNICSICEDAKVPFAVTMGNHDHDRTATVSEADMWKEIYSKYSYCVNGEVGGNFCTNFGETDYFTCNLPVKSSDGKKVALNVYVVDSNNNDGTNGNKGGYDGVNPDQVEWYKATSDALKKANGGKVVPSLDFQHVPVKEIYNLFKECTWNTPGAIYSRRDSKWYVLDENKVVSGELGEAPCSEDFDTITGQYQAWLEKGDIIGGWFAHDHVNNFYGKTDDGITLGYNGGVSFRSYGNGGDRSARLFVLDENDVENYETSLLFYKDVCNDSRDFYIVDLMSPALLTTLMKVVYALFGWAIELFK